MEPCFAQFVFIFMLEIMGMIYNFNGNIYKPWIFEPRVVFPFYFWKILCTWRRVYICQTSCNISTGILEHIRGAKLENQCSAVTRTKHIIEVDKIETLRKIHTYFPQIIKKAIETVTPSQL